jgi:hypothetical protein
MDRRVAPLLAMTNLWKPSLNGPNELTPVLAADEAANVFQP